MANGRYDAVGVINTTANKAMKTVAPGSGRFGSRSAGAITTDRS